MPYIFILPESGRNWFINDDKGFRYEDYLMTELTPAVETEFPNIVSRLIGGFSMGGATAFFLTLKYSQIFDMALILAI